MGIITKPINKLKISNALLGFPYFVINNEVKIGNELYKKELRDIQEYYNVYEDGADFDSEGSSGDYVATKLHFKQIKTLIDKEARFMFSKEPNIIIKAKDTDEPVSKQEQEYQTLVDKILEKSNFSKFLLLSAKDCFIGKRIAALVDIDERDGIQIHFYNSLEFYYETDYDSDRITKFVSFKNVEKAKSTSDRRVLVNKYEEIDDEIVMSLILYDGAGNVIEEIIPEMVTDLEYIPAVVITNDGTLKHYKEGVSEVESLMEEESGSSFLGSTDIDALRKGMNPIRYTVDMNPRTTENLSSSAGSFWDLLSNQNQDNVHPLVGVLAPALNHSDALKATFDRIRNDMYNQLDMPDIMQMQGMITSGKEIEVVYFPLAVRCDEKMKTWRPAIENLIQFAIDIALKNEEIVMQLYGLSGFKEIKYDIVVHEHYALLRDEQEEKAGDREEIAVNVRSRASYLKKWRKDEFATDEQINEELMQIAMEQNMFDTTSINSSVQNNLNKQEQNDIEDSLIEKQETMIDSENLL